MIHTNHEGRRIGESHPKVKHPDETVREARRLHEQGLGYKSIGKQLNVHWQTVEDWCTYSTRYGA